MRGINAIDDLVIEVTPSLIVCVSSAVLDVSRHEKLHAKMVDPKNRDAQFRTRESYKIETREILNLAKTFTVY